MGNGISTEDYQDDFQNIAARQNAAPEWAKDMESSKRFLLQAEIEYWHEMLRLNKSRVTRSKEIEMRNCLKMAVRSLNCIPSMELKAAA